MDLQEDTIKAFVALVDWLGRDPHREPTQAFGRELYVLRNHGEYRAELDRRRGRVAKMLQYLQYEGFDIPKTYTWMRFVEEMDNGLHFHIAGSGFSYDREAQEEILRVVMATMNDLIERLSDTPAATPPREPKLEEHVYERILSLIRQWGEGIERNPGALREMNEEAIRSNCLVMLNTHYGGGATGETFNKGGKTDILVRVENGAVFIAECKIWKGSQSMSEAVNQLLGYLAWRDTKAALMIFNRSGNTTKVIETAREAAVKHPQYVRSSRHTVEREARHVFAHPDEREREVTINVQVIDLPFKAVAS